jgi:hypothetical protein
MSRHVNNPSPAALAGVIALQPPLAQAGSGASLGSSLSASVLVLNKHYQAVRVVNVRRAFALLCKELAEVVHIETRQDGTVGQWQNLDFSSWQELSELHAQFEPDGFDWIRTVRFPMTGCPGRR